MELKEIKKMWEDYREGIDLSPIAQEDLLMRLTHRKIKSSLSAFKGYQIFELLVTSIFYIWVVQLAVAWYTQLAFFLPAVTLSLIFLATIIINIYNLYQVANIKFDTPVVEVQKKIEYFRSYEKWDIKSLYFLIPVFYISFIIVVAKALLGISLYEWSHILISQFLISIVVAAIIVFFLNKFPDKKLDYVHEFLEELNSSDQ